METKYEMVDKSGFEIRVCTRCGGSGHFSYNQMHGSRCYGCNGVGKQYTKRGLAARRFYEGSMKRPASAIKVGDKIRCEMMSVNGMSSRTYFTEVLAIEEKDVPVTIDGVNSVRKMLEIETKPSAGCFSREFQQVPHEHEFRVAHSSAEKAPLLKAALEYQDRLTLKGTEKKSR